MNVQSVNQLSFQGVQGLVADAAKTGIAKAEDVVTDVINQAEKVGDTFIKQTEEVAEETNNVQKEGFFKKIANKVKEFINKIKEFVTNLRAKYVARKRANVNKMEIAIRTIGVDLIDRMPKNIKEEDFETIINAYEKPLIKNLTKIRNKEVRLYNKYIAKSKEDFKPETEEKEMPWGFKYLYDKNEETGEYTKNFDKINEYKTSEQEKLNELQRNIDNLLNPKTQEVA